MRQHETELERRNIDVAVVTFEAGGMARAYVRQTDLRWPVLVDRVRRLYAAYAMDRAGFWQVWGPRSLWPYVADLARGRLPAWPRDDVRQRGGDVLIDPEGRVRLHHVGRTSIDRPAVSDILARVDRSESRT